MEKVTLAQPFTLVAKTSETADELAKSILVNAQKSLGFVPNMYGFMAINPALLEVYTHGYASFRANSGFSPIEQEVVFLSVSNENECEYCMAAHSFIADKMSNVPQEITNAIRDGKTIADVKLNALCNFTKAITAKRGRVSQDDICAFLDAGYTEKHIMGVVAGAGVKTFSNYANHIAHTPVDAAFISRKWSKQ